MGLTDTAATSPTWFLTHCGHIGLRENEVHVWLVRMDDADLPVESCEQFLASEEHERASRFKFAADRTRYIVGHGAFRLVLASYLKINPLDLQFSFGPNGKPKLAVTPAKDELEFNLSHSHEVALIAVTLRRQIGVDVEFIKKDFQWPEVAERFFAPGEVTKLRALPQEHQLRAFFTCWTRKEAYIKAKGEGLSIPLQNFEVSFCPGEPAALLGCKSEPKEATRWSLAEIEAGPDYAASVAVEGHGWQLKCRRWPHESNLPQSRK